MNSKIFMVVLGILAIGGAVVGLSMRGSSSDIAQIETSSGEATTTAATAPAAGNTIAVVDIQMLMRESSAAKALEAEVKTMRADFEKEITTAEQNLRTKEKELVESRKTLKEPEFNAKRDTFEKEVHADQEKMQKRRSELEGMISSAIEKLRGKIVEIVADISKANNYSLVLSRSDIVLMADSMNVTGQVMDKLNAAMPTLSAKSEAAPAADKPADAQPAAGDK